MDAENVLGLLDGVQSRGSGKWMACCPAHDDRSPSLSIKEGERGLLIRCWAGCDLRQIAQALGLRVSDFFFDNNAEPEQRRVQQQRRAQQRAESGRLKAETAVYTGMSCDLAREAEHLVLKLAELDRPTLSDGEQDRLLNGVIADAHTVLRSEMGEEAYVEWTHKLGRR